MLLPAVVAVLIATFLYTVHAIQEQRRQERFLPVLGVVAKAVIGTAVGFGATALIDKIGNKKKKYEPTYRGRVQDGYDWSCPDGSIETGNTDDSKACITSEFHPPVWKPNEKGVWGHNCPNGTTPTPESEWEKKCVVGYMGKVQTDNGWECPFGTTTTGATWNNSNWHDGHKQCKRGGAYTRRVLLKKAWVCPPGTKDTGNSWGKPHAEKMCKFTGP